MTRGKLTLVATPIGNLQDLSPRAIEVLSTCDFCLVEDSRVTGKLLSYLGIKKPMKVLNEHTSPQKIQEYVALIESGQHAALATDGGSPAISDPGAILTDLCHEADVELDAVPGPSAVITALGLSGFFAQRFAFLGFPPRKAGQIRELLQPFEDSPMTIVLFESPFRIENLLESAAEVLGNRRYVICRELTKMHQQVYRDRLPNRPNEQVVPRKGEITVIFEGKRRNNA